LRSPLNSISLGCVKANDPLADAFTRAKRLIEVLGKSPDLVLAVLRSHLLLEEQLREVVMSSVREPKHLAALRLSSSQVQALANAILGGSTEQLPWSFLTGLNALRNKLAHQVEVPAFELKVAKLTALVPVAPSGKVHPPHETVYFFTLAVARVSGEIYSRGRAFLAERGTNRAT